MQTARRSLVAFTFCAVLGLSFSSTDAVCGDNSQRDSAFSEGRGIDHLVVAVRDLEAAKDIYRDILGFDVRPQHGQFNALSSGMKNSAITFDNETYIELIAVNDAQKVAQNHLPYIDFLRMREGAIFLALNTSLAANTANFLRGRGFDVPAPSVGSAMRPVASDAPPPMWWIVRPRNLQFPLDRIFFIEWEPKFWESRKQRIATEGGNHHPNTAKGIAAVWIAVKNLETAVRDYQSFGLTAGEKHEFSALGAIGREVETKQGKILLLQSNAGGGKVAYFLENSGEGIMGVSIEVGSLKTVRKLLEDKTKQKFRPHTGVYGRSILIPAEVSHGVWIEMFQRAR